jgi:two-component system cell cycle sensor histidine kinase/response regulator CckA
MTSTSSELEAPSLLDTPRITLDALPHAISVKDTAGRFVLANETAARDAGTSSRHLIGKTDFDIYPEELAARYVAEDRAILQEGQPLIDKLEAVTDQAGNLKWHSTTKLPLRDDQGSIKGILIVRRDVTEQRRAEDALHTAHAELERRVQERTVALAQANASLNAEISERRKVEEALRASEERYRSLYRDSPSMLFTLDAGHRVLSVNPFGAHQLGYSVEELEGRSVLDVVHDADRESVIQHLQECLKKLWVVYSWQFRKVRKNGSLLWVEGFARAVRAPGGEVNVFVVCHDITERMLTEQERAKLEAQLRHAQKMQSIGLMAGGIAHDFNNLLSPILGYAELILGDLAPGDPRHEWVRDIMQAGKRASELTRQLLAFSRKQVLELKTVDLSEVVRRFERMLRRTIREDIRIEVVISPALGKVRADIGQIEQVLMNLAINGQDAIPKEGVLTIEAQNVTLDEEYARQRSDVRPGQYVMLAMSDTGVGMDPVTQESLFEPFFTTKERGKGTGLGLSTVYGIVKQHGGTVSAYSEPGKGSTFKVYLPRIVDSAATAASAASASSPETTTRGTETILVVEDNYLVRNLARDMLRSLGYRVLVADGAESCFQLTASYEGPIHLLLTDVVLPQLDGKQVFMRLRAKWPELKVLYMSGYTSNVIVHHGVLDAGVHFIQKPLSLQALSTKIRQVLDS